MTIEIEEVIKNCGDISDSERKRLLEELESMKRISKAIILIAEQATEIIGKISHRAETLEAILSSHR